MSSGHSRTISAPSLLVAVASSPTALSWRHTFIDVDDARPDAPAALPRARSAPPGRASGGEPLFDVERDYVAGLSECLSVLWSAVDASMGDRPGGAIASTQFFGPPRNDVVSERLLRQKVECGDAATETPTMRSGDSGEAPTAGSADSSDGTACAPSDSPSQEDHLPLIMNEGSMGHPYLCSRPCLYFSSGACANGLSCSFCHLPHPKRVAHLDKRHRDVLRALPAARVKELMLPLLWEKVSVFDATAACREAFEELVQACDLDDLPGDTNKSRNERDLLGVLGTLGVKSAFSTFQRATEIRAVAGDGKIGEAVERLIRQLRTTAAALQR